MENMGYSWGSMKYGNRNVIKARKGTRDKRISKIWELKSLSYISEAELIEHSMKM